MPEESTTTSTVEMDGESPTQDVETGQIDGVGGDIEENRPSEPEVDWRAKYEEEHNRYVHSRQGAEQLANQYRQLIAQAQAQQQWMAQQQAPPPSQRPEWGNDYLTDAERKQLNEAEENLDIKAINRIRSQSDARREQALLERARNEALKQVGGFAQQQASQIAELEAFKRTLGDLDQNGTQQVISEAFRIQSDPYERSMIRDIDNPNAYVPTPLGPVNRYAVFAAAKAYKGSLSGAKKQGQSAAAQSRSNTVGGAQRTMGEPGSSGRQVFNPAIHLSSDEREFNRRWSQKSRDPKMRNMGLKDYWNSLPPDLRAARLREGRPIDLKEYRQKYQK